MSSKKTIKRLLEEGGLQNVQLICTAYKNIETTRDPDWGCLKSNSKSIYSRPVYHASLIYYEWTRNDRSPEWICENLNTDLLGTRQIRHLCGDNECLAPEHLCMGTQEENEMDKHYHFFIRHPDEGMQDAVVKNPVALHHYLERGGIISRSQAERITPLRQSASSSDDDYWPPDDDMLEK